MLFFFFDYGIPNTHWKGHLHNYRLCDEVWTFIIKNAAFKLDNGEMLSVDKAKIVACKLGENNSR